MPRLFAWPEEEKQTSQQERIPVGTRTLTQAEWVKIQENRAELIQRIENGEIVTEEQKEHLTKEEQTTEEGNKSSQTQLIAKGSKSATTYYTTHQGAFHHPIAVSLLGENVEFEDGSIWTVCSSDRYQTLDWMTGDAIIILPNNSLFSSFKYRLVNLNTGANIRVDLTLGPIYNGLFTHWILAIDYVFREIFLEDGSVWKISSLDDSILYKWLPNDTIIIGINDGWLSSLNPNMLINVNMNNYVTGGCVN